MLILWTGDIPEAFSPPDLALNGWGYLSPRAAPFKSIYGKAATGANHNNFPPSTQDMVQSFANFEFTTNEIGGSSTSTHELDGTEFTKKKSPRTCNNIL